MHVCEPEDVHTYSSRTIINPEIDMFFICLLHTFYSYAQVGASKDFAEVEERNLD